VWGEIGKTKLAFTHQEQFYPNFGFGDVPIRYAEKRLPIDSKKASLQFWKPGQENVW
jgi:hypothetical protein